LAIALGIGPVTQGQLTEYTWTGGAGTNWHQDGNWNVSGFPNAGTHSAVVSSGSNLAVSLGGTNATVAALTLDGTSPATSVEIASSGGILILQNDDANEWGDPDGGDPAGQIAPIITTIGVNEGKALITSLGTAGTANVISAPVRINNSGFLEGLDVVGTRSLTISGDLDIVGEASAAPFDAFASLRSFLPDGEKVLVTGDIMLNDPVTAGNPARALVLNSYGTTDHGIVDGGTFPNDVRTPPRGTIEITGTISGTGGLNLGWEWAPNGEQYEPVEYDPAPVPAPPLGTVILSGDNTFTGNVGISRGNVVIRHDNALGIGGSVTQVGDSGDSKQVGFNLVIDDGDRTISNPLILVQWLTIKGNSSLTWNGSVRQDATRGIINLLPYEHQAGTGETITFNGPLYATRESENPPAPGRIMTFDGTGRTVLRGGVHNMLDDPETALSFLGSFRKRGTGSVIIDYDESNTNDTATDYGGFTFIEGGNLHFATNDDMPTPVDIGTAVPPPASQLAEIISSSGAIGVDTGVLGNSAFLGMLNNSNNPNHPPSGNFFRGLDALRPIFPLFDTGGLMLGSGEYGQNLNFDSGDLSRAANMTLAAHETGSTYTGTITPNDGVNTSSTTDGVVVNANTYQLGGGAGTLTLPLNNQLTGTGRHLLVTNGGEVRLEGSNNYTGTTRVTGKFRTSLQADAAADTADPDNDFDYTENAQQVAITSTLTITNLSNGGSPSSIGSASSAASNLLVQNATLKYVGAAVSTDRLFTVGTAGATIDASGTGALTFANTGALGLDLAENRFGGFSVNVPGTPDTQIWGHPTFDLDPGPGVNRLLFSTEDLVPGMSIRDSHASPQLQDDLVITAILGDHIVNVGEAQVDPGETPWAGVNTTDVRTMTFGGVARTLTLSGSNMDDNTLAPLITNAAAATGNNTVNLAKTGAGKWILTGNNTYSGTTTVNEGTLLINGNHTGTGLTTVNSGGTLGGTGSIAGALTVNSGGHLAPGASIETFDVAGAITLNAGSILDFELGAAGNPGTSDLLNSTLAGGLTINGGTVNLTNAGGLGAGTYKIIDYAGALAGNFSSLVLGTVPNGFGFSLENTGNEINVLVSAAPVNDGDFNNDGFIDVADFVAWSKGLVPSTPANYNLWAQTYGQPSPGGGSGGGSNVNGGIPEPSTLTLLAFAIAGLLCRPRRN
jgi:autotransporter-associated beta strand protein